MRGKKRAPNFSLSDKNLLLDLVAEKESIIESKRTDSQTNREKDLAWEAISEKYNAICPIPRNVGTLKVLWDNLKRRCRVEGIPITPDGRVEQIRNILNISFDGYSNCSFDSDQKVPFSSQILSPKLHSSDFEPEEKELLLQLISENIAVVENIENDKISSKEKEQIWENIAIMFNAQMERHRSLDSLKLWWLNAKLDVVRYLQSDHSADDEDSFITEVIEVLRKCGIIKQRTFTQCGQNKTVDYISGEFASNFPGGKSALKAVHKKRLLNADAAVKIKSANFNSETKEASEKPEENDNEVSIPTPKKKHFNQPTPVHSVNTNAKKVKIVTSGKNPVIDVVEPKPNPVCPMAMFFESLVPDAKSLTPSRQRLLKEKMLLTLNSLLEEQENDPSSSSYNANLAPSHIIYIQPTSDS